MMRATWVQLGLSDDSDAGKRDLQRSLTICAQLQKASSSKDEPKLRSLHKFQTNTKQP